MKEIEYYQLFADQFISYIKNYIDETIKIVYKENKALDVMIEEINNENNISISFNGKYIPKLKLDILFAFIKHNKYFLILFEAKYLNKLSLQNYSQLTGYLQVAKDINIGILLLIVKNYSPNKLSNDFNEIIRLRKLPMDWTQIALGKRNNFKTGVLSYQPKGTINWIDTSALNGISSFLKLADLINSHFYESNQ